MCPRLTGNDVRFFESASPHSNLSSFEFGIQNHIFILMFLIYDIDLVFFLVEVMVWDVWTCADLVMVFLLIFLAVFGLFYDVQRKSLHWF